MFDSDDDAKEENRSRFTYRDLRNLRRSAPTCPLRVIALIDFDAFYAQCEIVRLGLPETQPLAVSQWNICIALNYPAKAAGLKRIVTPIEAKLKCPELIVQHVATWREGDSSWAYRPDVLEHMKTDKAALDPYRIQSRRAFDLIKSKLPAPPVQRVEKASIDEVFLDLSSQVHALLLERYPFLSIDDVIVEPDTMLSLPPITLLDWQTDELIETAIEIEAEPLDWDDIALNIGAEIVRNIRQAIYQELKYTCSAGLARNKTLAKLAAGHNKPNQQTVVRARAIADFFSGYKFTKIRGLGGKLGHKVAQATQAEMITDLLTVPLHALRSHLGSESGSWVYNVIRGNEYCEVVERTQLQSMLAAKTFVPKAKDLEHAEKWLRIFAGDLMGRLHEQDATSPNRRPRVIALHHAIEGRFGPTRSKQMQIPQGALIDAKLLFDLSRELLVQISHEGPTWPCLGISVSLEKFEDGVSENRQVTSFFAPQRRDHKGFQEHMLLQDTPHNGARAPATIKRKLSMPDVDDTKELKTVKRSQTLITSRSNEHKPPATSPKDARYDIARGSNESPSVAEHCYVCPNCDQRIENADVLEHLDWHVAIEIQHS